MMLYRLYLYGTTATVASSLTLRIINQTLASGSAKDWEEDDVAALLKPFDIIATITRIEKELTDPVSKTCKCKAIINYPPLGNERTGFIFIATSYDRAAEVLPRLHMIAAENDLVLYDAETHRSFFRELVDRTNITMKIRQQEIHRIISNEMKPLWKIRRIESSYEERDKACSYVVTICKNPQVSFEERNKQFYQLLQENLRDDESLICENQCYTISGEWYEISYVLEGYKKHPDKIGYVEKWYGEYRPKVSLLHRMGADTAFRWLQENAPEEKVRVQERMLASEMRNRYPNPGERFVEISKWQKKQVFNIKYGKYGGEFSFHVVPNNVYSNRNSISCLGLDCEAASFLLAFIHDVCPDVYERYYDCNHISSQTWKRIIDRIRDAKDMILHDTFNSALQPYIKRFNLYIFENINEPDCWGNISCMDDAQLVYAHRYQIADLLDAFVQWSEAQLETYAYDSGLMFNILGP